MSNEELKITVAGLTIPQLADLKKYADERLRMLKAEHDDTARQLLIALGKAPRVRSDKGTKRAPKPTKHAPLNPNVRDAFDGPEAS